MTREEARLTLQANVIYACEEAKFGDETIELVEEALDMAIEALEKEKPPIIFRASTFLRREEIKEIERSLREKIPNAVVVPNYLEPVGETLLLDIKPGTPQIGGEVIVHGVLSLLKRYGEGRVDVELQNVKAIMKV